MNKNFKSENIDIITSWRIGDTIVTLPVLVCLHQLNQKFNTNFNIHVITQPHLYELISFLALFNCKKLNILQKIKSSFVPADKAFFLETTSRNLGYCSRISYGLVNPSKKLLKFSKTMPYLVPKETPNFLSEELISFLSQDCMLPLFAVKLFGVCLDLGFSEKQIIETFKFKQELIDLRNFSENINLPFNEKYTVICMEAAYGKSGDAYRCYNNENYFEIADRLYNDFGVSSVVIGLDTISKLPDKKYIYDMRNKLNLFQNACLLKASLGYIGNDTGPLHIANLMKKPSIGVYFNELSIKDFSPLFPSLNVVVYKPESVQDIYSQVDHLLKYNG